MTEIGSERPKAVKASWLLWWRVDPERILWEARHYSDAPFFESSRKIAFVCLAASAVISLLFVLLARLDSWSYVDIAMLGALAAFVYFGHRWAIVGAMVLWTLEKIIGALAPPYGVMAITSALWWAAYMHAFYMALKVENLRRGRAMERPEEVF